MVRNGKECKNPRFSSVAATVEKASTYVFAERLIRNEETGVLLLWSTHDRHQESSFEPYASPPVHLPKFGKSIKF